MNCDLVRLLHEAMSMNLVRDIDWDTDSDIDSGTNLDIDLGTVAMVVKALGIAAMAPNFSIARNCLVDMMVHCSIRNVIDSTMAEVAAQHVLPKLTVTLDFLARLQAARVKAVRSMQAAHRKIDQQTNSIEVGMAKVPVHKAYCVLQLYLLQ